MHHVTMFRRNALAGALAVAMLLPLGAFAQTAGSNGQPQDQSGNADTTGNKKPVTLQKVLVTGSRIARAQIEGPTPVTVISGEQIKAEGFTTVYEVMDSLTQVGRPETPPTWGSTSVNARQLNLRNLGPGRSLLLVDGHRVADYPQAAGGRQNFQNYNNIPAGMIERIEIVGAGASSIYGSDAIAGVVNIILKKHYEGDEVQFSLGGATHGGREYGDLNFIGGRAGDHWHVVYNLERSHRNALWGRDRPYTDSETDAGYGAWDYNARLFGWNTYPGLALNDANGNYIAPPASACGQFGNNFALRHSQTVSTTGHTVNTADVTDHGYYCTQPALFGNWVLTPGSDNQDAYVAGEYDFGGGLQLYGSAGLWKTTGTSNTELPFLYPMGGLPNGFYDQTSGQVISNYFRQLTPQELGGYGNTHDDEQNWDIHAGLRGTLMDDRFSWDLNLGTARYIVHEYYTGLNEQGMFDFFFGPQLGTTTVNGSTLPVYALNSQRFWNPITPAQYQSFGVSGENTASSRLDQASLNVAGDLFNTWTGQPVGFAGVLEAAHQNYRLSPDPRGNDTHFGDPFQDLNTGGGTRNRISAATEFRVPLASTLTATVSGRIDKYRDASATDIARTWGAALEFRPFDSLLLRANYGTNFRAPDMNYSYKQDSLSTVGIYKDPYQCIINNDPVCQAVQHSTYFAEHSGGGPNLLPETGHGWTYGFVWDLPWVDGLAVSADYWHTGIDNAIDYVGMDDLLADEAGCRTGKVVGGGPYLAHGQGSAYCQQAIADVKRDASGNITAIYVGPINKTQLYVSGIDAKLTYALRTQDWGAFNFELQYTDNLSYKERTNASDPLVNTRYDRVASKVRGVLSWHEGKWDATLYGDRAGSIRANNYGGCEILPNGIMPQAGDPDCVVYKGRTKPWIVWSTSVGYQFNEKVKVRLGVTNIFDNMGEIPYYAGGFEFIPTLQGANYNGREVLATLNYKLD